MERARSTTTDRTIFGGSDFLQLTVGNAPPGGLSTYLAGQLRAAISDGRLPLGSRLPATRLLAEELRVSRGVVTEAYQRLIDDGHVTGRGRLGTIVVAVPGQGQPQESIAMPAAEPVRYAGTPGPEIFERLRSTTARIDFSPGMPDLAAFPRAAWIRAERTVLKDLSSSALGYGDPRGAPALRSSIAGWLARNRGIRVAPDEIIIVAGVAQALSLIADVLRSNGIRTVAVEDPGSLGARQQLQSSQLATPPVPVDAGGIRVDELRSSGAPAVMLTPAHQFPTGVVLDGERRRDLIRWAGDGGFIIEDDYDAEHRYDRAPVPALRSMLTEQVFYAGSVSKLLAPALRIGWLIGPPRFAQALVQAKRNADLGNPLLTQLVLADLMDSGELERQLRFVRRRHRQRRDAMIRAIDDYLPGARVHGAAAGLHLMITFARMGTAQMGTAQMGTAQMGTAQMGAALNGLALDDDGHERTAAQADRAGSDLELATAALARGVKVHPLSWHCQRPQPPGLVLGYAGSTPSTITEGVGALGQALLDCG